MECSCNMNNGTAGRSTTGTLDDDFDDDFRYGDDYTFNTNNTGNNSCHVIKIELSGYNLEDLCQSKSEI